MTIADIFGLISLPMTILSLGAALFVGVAFASKKNRLETIKALKASNFGSLRFVDLAKTWSTFFYYYFGEKKFSKRQLVTIPIYTLSVSGLFFLIWILDLYIFKNPTHSITAHLPVNVIQAIKYFYTEGIFASLVIDFFTIQMTKICIEKGGKKGFYSFSFFSYFILTLLLSYVLFTFSVFFFRVEDMVLLYSQHVPNDIMPIVPYDPLGYFSSSLQLFSPQTTIYVTSRGWFSSYFMPEPLIFYCAIAAQVSLLFIAAANQIAGGIEKIKKLSITVVSAVGTPKASAISVFFVIILSLLVIPILALLMFAFFS